MGATANMVTVIETNGSATYLHETDEQWKNVISIALDAVNEALSDLKIKEATALALDQVALLMSMTAATVFNENSRTEEVLPLRKMLNDEINKIAKNADFGDDTEKAAPLLENIRMLMIETWIPERVLLNKDEVKRKKAFVGKLTALSKRPEMTGKKVSDAVMNDYNNELKTHPTITQAVVQALTGCVGPLFSDHLQVRTEMEGKGCTQHNAMEMKPNGIVHLIAHCRGRQHPSHEDKELARMIQKAYEAEKNPSRLLLAKGAYFQSFNELGDVM